MESSAIPRVIENKPRWRLARWMTKILKFKSEQSSRCAMFITVSRLVSLEIVGKSRQWGGIIEKDFAKTALNK